MQQKKKPGVDVIMDVLIAVQKVNPDSVFINSLMFQYQERGGLSKKQLEGLHSKASKGDVVSTGKLATLQAIILKKHTKHKSPLPVAAPLYTKDEETGNIIAAILKKYPLHKQVLLYRNKFDNNESLTAAEKSDLEKFKKILLK